MNIEIISGSPRNDSLTNRVVWHLKEALDATSEHTTGIIDVREWNLPFLQEVFPTIEATPDIYKPLAEKVFNADAFILVTPEYNGSYSPAMQNLLDHFPKQRHKAFGVVTASTGAMGGMRSSQQLLLLIPALFGIASPYLLIIPQVDKKFDASGALLDLNFKKSVDIFLTEFLWLAEKLNKG